MAPWATRQNEETDTLLGDQQRDKEFQRNQMIFILLSTGLLLAWLYFFPPKPYAPTPPPVAQVGSQALPVQSTLPAPVPEPGTEPDTEPGTAAPGAIEALKYDPAAAPAQEFVLSNEHLELVFTDIGARLKQGTVIVEHGENQPLVPTWADTPEDQAVYPLGLVFQREYLGELLNTLRWSATPAADGRSIQFQVDLPEPYAARLTKTFAIASDHPNVVDVSVSYTNTGAAPRLLGLENAAPAYSLYWAPNVNSGDAGNRMVHQEVVWRENAQNVHTPTSKLVRAGDGSYSKVVQAPDWLAIKSAYFIVAMKAGYEGARGWALGDPGHFQVGLEAPRMELAAGASDTRAFKVYLGPLQGGSLGRAWPSLNTSLQFFTMFGFMDLFAKGMLYVLNWFHGSVIANYGFAIIFLTILVRAAMFPLTLKGMKSMKKMQKLAPEMEKLKAEIGDDQQEMQKRMMELYRERGVNPLGGCMPMLMQMPVFIALYRVYATAFEFRGAPFVGWIKDLSEPDALFTLPFAIPLPFTNGIDSVNLLPVLMGIAMVASTKLMPTSGPAVNPQQKMIMTMMPIMFSVICYNMAAGLNLYILTSTVLGIVQNYFVHVSDEELKSKPGKAKELKQKRRRKHFYLAAQDKKREMAREERREKKKKSARGKTVEK